LTARKSKRSSSTAAWLIRRPAHPRRPAKKCQPKNRPSKS